MRDFFHIVEHICFIPFSAAAAAGVFLFLLNQWKNPQKRTAFLEYFLLFLFLWGFFSRYLLLKEYSTRYFLLMNIPIFYFAAYAARWLTQRKHGKILTTLFFIVISIGCLMKLSRNTVIQERKTDILGSLAILQKEIEARPDRHLVLALAGKHQNQILYLAKKQNFPIPIWFVPSHTDRVRFLRELAEEGNFCEGMLLWVAKEDELPFRKRWSENPEWGPWQKIMEKPKYCCYYLPHQTSDFSTPCSPLEVQPHTGPLAVAFYPLKQTYPVTDRGNGWRNAFQQKGLPIDQLRGLPDVFAPDIARSNAVNTKNLQISMIVLDPKRPASCLRLSNPDETCFLFWRSPLHPASKIHFRVVYSGTRGSWFNIKGYGYQKGKFVALPVFAQFRCLGQQQWKEGNAVIEHLDESCDTISLFLEFRGSEINLALFEIWCENVQDSNKKSLP